MERSMRGRKEYKAYRGRPQKLGINMYILQKLGEEINLEAIVILPTLFTFNTYLTTVITD